MLNTAIVVTEELVYEILMSFHVWAPHFLYKIMIQTRPLKFNAGQGNSFAFLCILSDELALEIFSKDKTIF